GGGHHVGGAAPASRRGRADRAQVGSERVRHGRGAKGHERGIAGGPYADGNSAAVGEVQAAARVGNVNHALRRQTIHPAPITTNVSAITCARVMIPKNRSSLARKNSTTNRSSPASTM